MRRPNIDKLSDSQLLLLYNETRSKEHYGELFLRYLVRIYGCLLLYTGGREEAKQAIFEFYDYLPERLIADLDSINEYRDWLYKQIVTFVEKRFLEPEGNSKNLDKTVGNQNVDSRLSEDAKKLLKEFREDQEQVLEKIESCADELTKPQKECLELFFYEHLSFAEISAKVGYLTTDIRIHLEKGLNAIATSLEDEENSKKGGRK